MPNSKRAEEWFLVNPQVNIPTGTAPAEVVLMRRSAFRQIAAEARDASRQTASGPTELTAEDRKRVLVEAAARHGLTAEQLETALQSFAETQDPKDKGIAAYLEGEYPKAEEFLNKAAEKKETDFVETLRYLGASQYEQAKYRVAADTFRKAITLRGEEPELLSWLGITFLALAEWVEAEPLMRRALAIDEKSVGPDHPDVARDLNNLAQLLQATNRIAEAEPLYAVRWRYSWSSSAAPDTSTRTCEMPSTTTGTCSRRWARPTPRSRRRSKGWAAARIDRTACIGAAGGVVARTGLLHRAQRSGSSKESEVLLDQRPRPPAHAPHRAGREAR